LRVVRRRQGGSLFLPLGVIEGERGERFRQPLGGLVEHSAIAEILVRLAGAIGGLIPALDLAVDEIFLGASFGLHLKLTLDELVEIFDGEQVRRRQGDTVALFSDHSPELMPKARIANDPFSI